MTASPSQIPFIDLAAQQARLKPAIDAAIARVLAHGGYIMGPEVRGFEEQLAAFGRPATRSPAPTAPMRWRCR